MQGCSVSQAEREALPRLSASAAAIRKTLNRHEAKSLTAHQILCHSEIGERQRSDDMSTSLPAGSDFTYLIRDYHGSKKILGGGQAKEYSRVRFPIQGTWTGGRDLTQSIIMGL
jgi:hypothetical protein